MLFCLRPSVYALFSFLKTFMYQSLMCTASLPCVLKCENGTCMEVREGLGIQLKKGSLGLTPEKNSANEKYSVVSPTSPGEQGKFHSLEYLKLL